MRLESVEKVKRSRAFTLLDGIVLITIIAAIALAAALIFSRPAASVRITAPGYSRTLALDSDTTLKLEHLTVHIRSGKVWVTDADCPDGICQRTGKISRSGQSIVCLPHGIVITIEGRGDLQWEIG